MVHQCLQVPEIAVISRRFQWFPKGMQKLHADDVSDLGSTSDGRNEGKPAMMASGNIMGGILRLLRCLEPSLFVFV